MKLLIDPSIGMGLLTLIVLEIVLGIDNLIFIAILADKLPPQKRDNARIIGLSMALIIRLALLSLLSGIATFTRPLFMIGSLLFSGRDLILLFGGFFLLFKATTELHERLENRENNNNSNREYTNFWVIVAQIIILDIIFSLDTIITAVGMVNNLPIMMTAVIIAMAIMLLASRSLTSFIKRHQTVVVLCLSFLLMIGLSLIAEGFNFYIPKGYLYTAIVFSILIEILNQIARRNFIKNQTIKPIRERTAEVIMRLIQGNMQQEIIKDNSIKNFQQIDFAKIERQMITSIISFTSQTLSNIMTPRNKIIWLNCQQSLEELRSIVIETKYNILPMCNGELDQLIGIVCAKDLIVAIDTGKQIKNFATKNLAIIVPETMEVLKIPGELRRSKVSMLMVSDKFGFIQGLVTQSDLLKAITNNFCI